MKTQQEIEQLAIEKYGTDGGKIYYKTFIDGYNQSQNDMLYNQIVTRFEVIDETGRVYSKRNCNIELSYQDDGRTLKVFIKNENKQ